MKVRPLTANNQSDWYNFIKENPKANFYQLSGWKEVFESIFGYRSYYLLAYNDRSEVDGILPMMLMKDIFRRKYLVSNPFSNFAGICANNAQAENALLNRAYQIAANETAQYIEFRQLENGLKSDLPAKESFVTLMLKLPSDPEELWSSISSRNRNKIRKAEKNGLLPDFGMKYLDAFHEIYSENLRHLGTPIFPLRMFKEVAESFKDNVDLLVLKLDNKVVSGMFLFKFKEMISEPWVASLRQYNKIYVNNCLYWQAIKYACESGFKVFDFGRSTKESGTFNFKTQWGAEPVQLYYQYYLYKAAAIPVVDAKNNKYQKIIDLWKTLPLSVTNFIGPRVVQYLPEL